MPPMPSAMPVGQFGLGWFRPASRAVGIAIMGNATNYHIDAIARLVLTRT